MPPGDRWRPVTCGNVPLPSSPASDAKTMNGAPGLNGRPRFMVPSVRVPELLAPLPS